MISKILLLSDINSSHTQKWCMALSQKGVSVGIFSLSLPTTNWFEKLDTIKVFAPVNFSQKTFYSSSLAKIKYLKTLPFLKKVIAEFKPQVVHAHYASSYGLIGALSRFTPFLISVWGSDIIEFAKKSYLHKKIVGYNLNSATIIMATSNYLNELLSLEFNKSSIVIPFGIDLTVFKNDSNKFLFHKDDIVIGTIKSLEDVYGVDTLIKAFILVKEKNESLPLKLLIVGTGSKEKSFKELANSLSLSDSVMFTGRVDFNEVSRYHNNIDIFVNLSLYESFGVAVLEASACEKPIVATNVGGLREVVKANITGLLVNPGDVANAAAAIEKLVLQPELCSQFGKAGRKMVETEYDWNKNVIQQIEIYNSILK